MTAAEKELHRKRCASRAVDVLRGAASDDLGVGVAALILELDSGCEQRLVAGLDDLVGSVEALRPVFDSALSDSTLLRRLNLSLAETEDPKFCDALFQALLEKLRNEGEIVFVADR